MRIFGYFKNHPLSAAYIDAVLSFRGYYDRITFLIDTGATRTSILDRGMVAMFLMPFIMVITCSALGQNLDLEKCSLRPSFC